MRTILIRASSKTRNKVKYYRCDGEARVKDIEDSLRAECENVTDTRVEIVQDEGQPAQIIDRTGTIL